MKQFSKTSVIKFFPTFLITALFLLAVLVRLFHWQNYPFGFDQVQILENAHAILHGHPTLIGPRTGPADLFTGPLIYYITAFFLMVFPDIASIFLTSITISLATGLILLWLLHHYRADHITKLTYMVIWAISPFVVSLDRITWNPNLTYLASILVFFPLVYRLCHSFDRIDIACLFLGSFLGYQAHFTAIILPILTIILLLLIHRRQYVIATLSFLGLLVSFIPTIVFDIRHQWLNYHGLINLILHDRNQAQTSYFVILLHNLFITTENVGKLLLTSNSNQLVIWFGLGVIILILINTFVQPSQNKRSSVAFLWLIFIIILFSFYHQSSPEYYFIVEFPAIIWLIAQLIHRIYLNNSSITIVVVGSIISYTIWTNLVLTSRPAPLGIGNQLRIAAWLAQRAPYSSIDYQMSLTHDIGLRYLLSTVSLSPTAQAIVITESSLNNLQLIHQIGGIYIMMPVNPSPVRSPL